MRLEEPVTDLRTQPVRTQPVRTQPVRTQPVRTQPLAELSAAGVAVWLDDLSRARLRSGNLADLVRTASVVGVTTNPSIFQNALSSGEDYDEQVLDLALRGTGVGEAVRALTTYDVRWACDVLRDVYERTDGTDGCVSIEVDPRIARDRRRTVAEARALWWLVDRPNLFIKIPATVEGLPAITETLAAGISVNVTLIFSLERYEAVMEAFLTGLERAAANGHDLRGIASVASFFVSRVDTEIDARLDKLGRPELRGRAALVNARLAYAQYERVFDSARWQELARRGARPQRPLWASTGVKDPAYDDTRYVVELVAPGTVNTMPEATLSAVADHGVVRGDTIAGTYDEAEAILGELRQAGIDYDDVVRRLEEEGLQKFEDAWNSLLDSVAGQLERARVQAEVPS
ncbi:transaldolase [Planosporangium flavigriseum]|uniref:Transaldolase n=1 Tax=Planosporangium flavigriseum TaxID=373681 RepID=A0A8J3LPV6_9ACTN|nr:transaldolase 1 [Planosporangium flavigriseum]